MQLFRQLLLFSILLDFLSCSPRYSDNTTVRSFPESYTLDQLPPEWKKKPKTIALLDEILPGAVKQLANCRSCINCKATYSVTVKIDSVYIMTQTYDDYTARGGNVYVTNKSTTTFRFKSHLNILDSSGQEIVHLLIVTPGDDIYTIRGTDGARKTTVPVRYYTPRIGWGFEPNDFELLELTRSKLKVLAERIRRF